MRRLSWIIQVSPNCHHKREAERFNTEGKVKTEAEIGAKEHQGLLAATRS